jgi:hypothetical protein
MITSGSYSDYRVHAVCSDRNTAKQWAEAATKFELDRNEHTNPYCIEEVQEIETGSTPEPVTTCTIHADLLDSGYVSNYREFSRQKFFEEKLSRPRTRYIRAPIYKDKGRRIEITGSSLEAIRKVYSEKIGMWKAGAWGGPGHEETVEEV